MLKFLLGHNFIKKYWLIALACGIFIFLTLPAIFDANHFFYNLEPYPDGLLYALSGRNLILSREFQLVYLQENTAIWTAPLYPLLLVIGYLFSTKIAAFYILNMVFQLINLVLLLLILEKTVSKTWIRALTVIVYLTHVVIFWLPTIPMSENLSLMLFMLMIYSYFETQKKRRLILLGLALAGLLLTRYAVFGVVLGGATTAILVWQRKNKKINSFAWGLPLLFVGIFELILRLRGASLWSAIQRLLSSDDPFFGTRFIWTNITAYAKMLFFSDGLFLWQHIGVSNVVFMGLFVLACVYFYRIGQFKTATILTVLFLSQLPLQLVFYLADARYLIYSIPLIALGIGWLMEAWTEKRTILIPLVIFGIVVQLFMQQVFVKEIIANNLLGRSTAWQYEAVLQFNRILSDDSLIITALPPFLVDTYQTQHYRVLPLAYDQEFLQKKQYVWGKDINYQDLHSTYQAWLEEGKELYISNAYITHQQSVIEDYESYKESFEFELMAEGCDQACNIYRLSLK
jgi:hypothetical protein